MKFNINSAFISRYNMMKLFLSDNFVLIYDISDKRVYRNYQYQITFEKRDNEYKMELREDGVFLFRVFLQESIYHKLLAMKHESNNN